MTAKDKAKELVHRFQKTLFFHVTDERIDIQEAKQCALIAVDEILEAKTKILNKGDGWQLVECNIYWKEVKTEIQNL